MGTVANILLDDIFGRKFSHFRSPVTLVRLLSTHPPSALLLFDEANIEILFWTATTCPNMMNIKQPVNNDMIQLIPLPTNLLLTCRCLPMAFNGLFLTLVHFHIFSNFSCLLECLFVSHAWLFFHILPMNYPYSPILQKLLVSIVVKEEQGRIHGTRCA